MNTQTTTRPVRKTVTIKQPVDQAFALFTGRIAEWCRGWDIRWPLGWEPDPARWCSSRAPKGRIYQRRDDGVLDYWGEVAVWDPPHRLLLAWHPAGGAASATEVEIRFTADADGTRVDLEHWGWDKLGAAATVTRDQYDSGWTDVLRMHVAAGRDNNPAIVSHSRHHRRRAPLLGLLAAPFAIAFGIAGRHRARHGSPHGGLATAGLTLGMIALTLWAVIAALGLGLVIASNGQEKQVPAQPASQPAN